MEVPWRCENWWICKAMKEEAMEEETMEEKAMEEEPMVEETMEEEAMVEETMEEEAMEEEVLTQEGDACKERAFGQRHRRMSIHTTNTVLKRKMTTTQIVIVKLSPVNNSGALLKQVHPLLYFCRKRSRCKLTVTELPVYQQLLCCRPHLSCFYSQEKHK